MIMLRPSPSAYRKRHWMEGAIRMVAMVVVVVVVGILVVIVVDKMVVVVGIDGGPRRRGRESPRLRDALGLQVVSVPLQLRRFCAWIILYESLTLTLKLQT